jgi:hypothetical protein
MASDDPAVPGTEEFPDTAVAPRTARKPFWKDPLSLIGWGLALGSVVAYWYFFVRQRVPEPGEQVARVTAIVGNVRVKPNALEVWNDLHLEAKLHVGDVVQTEQRSGTEISFLAGSVVRVRPQSIVYLGGSAEQSTAAWRVESGRVNFSVGDQVTQIVTPTLTTTAEKNASGHIDVGAQGDTGVKIFSGSAEVATTSGQTITLLENEAVQVDAAGQAGEKQALPPPPTLLSPTIKAVIPYAAPPEATAELTWERVVNGKTYHVSLDYNVLQANLLLSATLDAPGLTQPTHELKGLDPGRYFWRVAAVNESGLEGAFSRVSFFSVEPLPQAEEVEVPAPAPGLPVLSVAAVEEVAPGVLHVRGKADPGSSVTVNDHEMTVLPDGSFSEHIRRPGGNELMIRATRPDGQFSEQSRSIPRGQ